MAETCPDENALLDLISGTEAPEVARHVAGCPTCSRVLADAFGEPEAVLAPGTTLDRFTIVNEIGRGGVGVVYDAIDRDLDRHVALKVLRRASPEASSRLAREARALARLDHANVVAVFAHGVGETSVPYIAMELVPGRSLRELMIAPNTPKAVLLRVLRDAGKGLSAAHRAGIIHRDFKPANVLVDDSGRAVVVDFGLSAAPDAVMPLAGPIAGDESRLTMTGQVFGTPGYSAPEQLAGRATDARSDQFSFCVVLVHVLSGVLPFRARDLAELRDDIDHARIDAAALAKLPRRLRRVAMRGLAADPARRYPSMDALLAAVEGRRRRLALVVAGAVVVAAMIAVAIAGLARGGSSARDRDPCTALAGHIDGVWNARVQLDVERSLARRLDAPQVARIGGQLASWGRRWREERTTVCAAKTDLDPRSVRVAGCLDDVLVDFAATVDVLSDPETVPLPIVVAALPSPAGCRAAKPSPPSGQPREARVAGLRNRIAVLADIGQHGGIALTVLTGTPESGNRLYRLSLPEGRITDIGPIARAGDLWELPPDPTDPRGALTYDRKGDVLVAIDRTTGAILRTTKVDGDILHNGRGLAASAQRGVVGLFRGRDLATIDPRSGRVTVVSTLDERFQLETMAFCPGDRLYAASTESIGTAVGRTLVTIDLANGAVAILGPIGATAIDIDTLACSRDGSLLFGVDTINAETNELFAIDPHSGSRTSLGAIPGPVNGLFVEP